ncbi:MAG: hypothetical protein AAB846_01225 [Patescibacteria group bacterium]
MRVSRKKIALSLVAVFVAFYGLWQARPYLGGPRIEVAAPTEGTRVTEERMVIRGNASNVSHLTLNGRPIFTDEKGNFEEDFLVAPGESILEIKGTDKFGRERLVRRMVYRP